MFTDLEKIILKLVASWRNYDNLEDELNDNACGIYFSDIKKHTSLDNKITRGVVSSLIQKDMLYPSDVNGEDFYYATEKCLEYLYNVLDKESLV